MRKMGLYLLVLTAMFAIGSIKTYAQCAIAEVGWKCGNTWYFGCQGYGLNGALTPGYQARCGSQIIPETWTGCGEGCYISKNMTDTVREDLARLSLHNRVFLIACNGDFTPFRSGAVGEKAKEPTWSADRAISVYEGKLVTR